MKTIAVQVSSLSVPCYNRCRYCLLSWDGHCRGISYEACRDYALGFHRWLKENRPEVDFQFYFAYSMEHPRLLETVDFMQENGYVQGQFLQFDGLKLRTPEESMQLLRDLKAHGVKLVDFTFYGTRDYHDRFAARTGDFDFMMGMLRQAREVGMDAEVGIPVTHENAHQLEELIGQVEALEPQKIFCLVPHGEGRGVHLDKVRFTRADYDSLSPKVQALFNRTVFRTEGEWVSQGLTEPEGRVAVLVPTPENFEMFQTMGYEKTLAYLETLDNEYHAALPSDNDLLKLYGDPEGQQFYSRRDLVMHLQRRYLAEHGLEMYDIHDERQCFVRRV